MPWMMVLFPERTFIWFCSLFGIPFWDLLHVGSKLENPGHLADWRLEYQSMLLLIYCQFTPILMT